MSSSSAPRVNALIENLIDQIKGLQLQLESLKRENTFLKETRNIEYKETKENIQ